jgi:hypothetical protein
MKGAAWGNAAPVKAGRARPEPEMEDAMKPGNAEAARQSLQQLTQHMEVLNREMGETRDEVRGLRGENASAHLEICQRLCRLETQTDWLARMFWLLAGAAVTGLAAAVLNLVLK